MTTAPSRHWGVNPDLSRFIGTVDGTWIWLVPGSVGSCIYSISGDPNLRSFTIHDASGKTFTTSAPGRGPAPQPPLR